MTCCQAVLDVQSRRLNTERWRLMLEFKGTRSHALKDTITVPQHKPILLSCYSASQQGQVQLVAFSICSRSAMG